jgi:hypothetical protein
MNHFQSKWNRKERDPIMTHITIQFCLNDIRRYFNYI